MHKNTQTPSCAPARGRADIRNPLRYVALHQITAPQFIRRSLHSSWYKQIPTHCLLLFTIEAGDLLDLVKNTMKDTKKIEKIMLFLLQMPA